jgi:tetratricopeptide (TPR) repeat protein
LSRTIPAFVPAALALTLGLAFAQLGTVVPDRAMPCLDGNRHALVDHQRLTVLLFFDPAKPRCLDVMKKMADLQDAFARNTVRWVGILSDRFDPQRAVGAARDAGLDLEILIDRGDTLYGALEVRLYPTVCILDRTGVLKAYLPYRRVNFTGALEAEIRHALGEIGDADLERALHPRAAEIGGANAEAGRLLRFAGMLWKMGEKEKALATARKALETAPGSAEARATVGIYLAGMGSCDEAIPNLQKALEADPDNSEARRALTECRPPDEPGGSGK